MKTTQRETKKHFYFLKERKTNFSVDGIDGRLSIIIWCRYWEWDRAVSFFTASLHFSSLITNHFNDIRCVLLFDFLFSKDESFLLFSIQGSRMSLRSSRTCCFELLKSIPVLFILSIVAWSYYAYVVQMCIRMFNKLFDPLFNIHSSPLVRSFVFSDNW